MIILNCPKCNSSNINTLVEKESKGFNVCDGLCGGLSGYICLGPIGLLCIFCGYDSNQTVRTTCRCNDCGTRFMQ